VIKIVI